MIISRTEILNAAGACRPWEPNVIPFPARSSFMLMPHAILWTHATYHSLPALRDTLVLDLRSRILAGRYFVPADQIVEKLLGRLLINRIAI